MPKVRRARRPKADEKQAKRPPAIALATALKGLKTHYGPEIILSGHDGRLDVRRIPTGIFRLDYALLGGPAAGRFLLLWGRKASGKTSALIKLAASYQQRCAACYRLWPECACPGGRQTRRTVLWVDLENAFDPKWATALGMRGVGEAGSDPEYKVLLTRPEYGEQAVDVIDAMLRVDEVGLVIVDSTAMLTPWAEVDSSAVQKHRGVHAQLITGMYRKMVTALATRARRGPAPTVCLVQQVRDLMAPVPTEIMPGGHMQRFAASVVCRFRQRASQGKDGERPFEWETKDGFRTKGPLRGWTRFQIQHSKISPPEVEGTFPIVLREHAGLHVGDIDDFDDTLDHALALGAIPRTGAFDWEGARYPASRDLLTAWLKDRTLYARSQDRIIELACSAATL
jgi:recombination protein RecA